MICNISKYTRYLLKTCTRQKTIILKSLINYSVNYWFIQNERFYSIQEFVFSLISHPEIPVNTNSKIEVIFFVHNIQLIYVIRNNLYKKYLIYNQFQIRLIYNYAIKLINTLRSINYYSLNSVYRFFYSISIRSIFSQNICIYTIQNKIYSSFCPNFQQSFNFRNSQNNIISFFFAIP